jgi:hypothetical protein
MHIKLPASRRAARLSAVLALLATPALLGAVLAGPASASTSFTVHVTPNNTLGLLLDVSGASTAPGAPVIDWFANGGANQEWTFLPDGGNNTYEIVNVNSGMCLTTDGIAGDQVYQLSCAGSQIQQWTTGLNPGNAGYGYTIKSVYSGLYLDVSGNSAWPGASIDTWPYNGGSNQFFGAL